MTAYVYTVLNMNKDAPNEVIAATSRAGILQLFYKRGQAQFGLSDEDYERACKALRNTVSPMHNYSEPLNVAGLYYRVDFLDWDGV